ncbi:MAG: toll/interleukin-1 receptor domain-containing protein, partial [Verrucomicrobiaceae bacterium]
HRMHQPGFEGPARVQGAGPGEARLAAGRFRLVQAFPQVLPDTFSLGVTGDSDMPSVFLSHSSRDKAFARKLAERLVAAGVTVWLDEAELNVGDSLLDRISSAIETTDFVAAVISHTSVQSTWVQTELQMAMTRELADRRVRVLPILIEPCELPMYLRDKLYADFSLPDDFDAPFARLLRALGVDRPLSELAPPGLPKHRLTSAPAAHSKRDPTSQTGLQEFVDVQIIGVAKDRTYNPDPAKSLFNVYLELSGYPPQE